VTSPTCFREITTQTGFDVAQAFIAALERAVNEVAVNSAGVTAGVTAGAPAGL